MCLNRFEGGFKSFDRPVKPFYLRIKDEKRSRGRRELTREGLKSKFRYGRHPRSNRFSTFNSSQA